MSPETYVCDLIGTVCIIYFVGEVASKRQFGCTSICLLPLIVTAYFLLTGVVISLSLSNTLKTKVYT